MVKKRIPLSEETKRKLLVEAGHKCSIPGCNVKEDWIFHHINFDPSDNREENIIVLCPNHATNADKKKISPKSCEEYKRRLMLGQVGKELELDDQLSIDQNNLRELIEEINDFISLPRPVQSIIFDRMFPNRMPPDINEIRNISKKLNLLVAKAKGILHSSINMKEYVVNQDILAKDLHIADGHMKMTATELLGKVNEYIED